MGFSKVVGRDWADDKGFYTPHDLSMLYGCADDVDVRPLADQAQALGFDGGRFFGGKLEALDGRPQHLRPEDAAERIERNAQILAERGLELHDVLFTDTKVSWDFVRHTHEHGQVAKRNANIRILELVNEIGHGSQRTWSVTELREREGQLRELGYDRALTAGAALLHDELMPPNQWGGLEAGAQSSELIYPPAEIGNLADTHYDRGRWPFWINVAHGANELRILANHYKKARLSGEPGRADHMDVGGHQVGYGYLLGVSATGFGNRTVFHASQPRDCQVMTGSTLDAAKAFIRGGRILPRGRYDFHNANNTNAWPNSPIKSAAFVDGPATNGDKTVWRAWSFFHVETQQWYLVLSGPNVSLPGLEFQHGFALGPLLDNVDNVVRVYQLLR